MRAREEKKAVEKIFFASSHCDNEHTPSECVVLYVCVCIGGFVCVELFIS